MSAPHPTALAYRAAAEAKDVDAILALMADGIRMHSPTKHAPFEGKDIVRFLFGQLMDVLEAFRFERIESAGDHATLYFSCTIGGKSAEGIDSLHIDADGRIDDFRVMIRPLNALQALNAEMGARLARHSGGP
ncbi:MAG: nuclear transport factor 2 family protein [Sphingomonadaceae bacterium]